MSETGFYALAYAPGLITLGVLAVMMLKQGRIGWPLGCAVVGCFLAASSPWILHGFVWSILEIHTANMGAAALEIFQPILAPMGAALGGAIGAAVDGPNHSEMDGKGDLPPIM